MPTQPPYVPRHKIRIVSAAALFDGHDAAINVMRRILQMSGAEVVHLGHNRGAEEVVDAAIEEDAQGIAVSSYQGGHIEYFKYMVDLLAQKGAASIRIFGGGGGVIVPDEIGELEAHGVAKIFSPADGQRLGLQGMINIILAACDFLPADPAAAGDTPISWRQPGRVARAISLCELQTVEESAAAGGVAVAGPLEAATFERPTPPAVPVVGLTGTGGAGKSSLCDELLRRFLVEFPDLKVGILSIDPTKRKTGGALLGDRIRMNALEPPRTLFRSLATRESSSELSAAVGDAIEVLKRSGYDLVFVETSGIGQGDAEIRSVADVAVYVMTSDFGAQSQLEKIDMLDYADLVAINKFERRGSEDALRDVRRQIRRVRGAAGDAADDTLPVYPTIASHFNDPGVNRLFGALLELLAAHGFPSQPPGDLWSTECAGDWRHTIIPAARLRYLAEIAEAVRDYKGRASEAVDTARQLQSVRQTRALLAGDDDAVDQRLCRLEEELTARQDPGAQALLDAWPELKAGYAGAEFVYSVRQRQVSVPLSTTSLAGTRIPKVALPETADDGEILRYLLLENVPGQFPFTAGVFPLRRQDEDPIRMFAGEGSPERTNQRFHYLSEGHKAKRLSTAFDSVTLYGSDPDERPDIYGKVGESGVSVCTLDDMRRLYEGFDLCDPNTSVSMTINGPAPIILAMFMNAAIDQEVERFANKEGRRPNDAEYAAIEARTLSTVRGTVQADILKEDQAQNTCIFSIEFALKMMGDVQEYFIERSVRNYYSVSISGYHIAEAGANPITQLALTLANGFTYIEYYRSRGMAADEVAPNLSFFFSNGLDPEYSVIGRVARRIWAVAMKERYGAGRRSQRLKYHIQTSGRSLHAQEVQFNDIRTTLQALIAYYDNCNSLHTNAYDEAVTTPTEESVRRAMAIQMIIAREFGQAKNENVNQGSYFIDALTNLVEEAVLAEFERLSDRGGVLGAMETQYQRSKIQEESLRYERLKHTGELPIVGVNTFVDAAEDDEPAEVGVLTRATPAEKDKQVAALCAFHTRHAEASAEALGRLKRVAAARGNIFAELMHTVRVASLGQITRALYEVGGAYRRSM